MKKPIELTGAMKLYCKSMGKIFRVFAVCHTEQEANDYCAKHEDAAVIAEAGGLIFIACKYSSKVSSALILD